MTREEALKIWLPVIKMGVESMPECSEALDMAIEALQREPKTGHWIDGFGGSKCSECGCLEAGHSDYCPICGAKMVEGWWKE